MMDRVYTTKELADKFKVKLATVYDTNSKFGHFKGFEKCGRNGTVKLWKFVGK